MSTKIWIDDKMYLVDEEVRESYDDLQTDNDRLNTIIHNRAEDLEVKAKYEALQAKLTAAEKALAR